MKPTNFHHLSIFLVAALLSGLSPFGGAGGGTLFAQGEANFWYFGEYAGLDFSGGAPVAVINGQLNTSEGCASMSNATGNLLFYTDGITVWNNIHIPMPNGFGLMGHISTFQSALIIQKPGSATIYYIFTADYEGSPNGIRYTEVDMTLNGGLGDVTANKNILLNTPSTEKLTGIRHCNNKDVWVVTHDSNSDAFRIYLITAAGVNPSPIVSNIGIVNGVGWNAIGQVKGSPDGKKLVSTTPFLHTLELFNFDNSTGVVSNAILFPLLPGNGAFAAEFSADVTKMYISCDAPNNLYQFNLCAGSNTAIANSGVIIGTPSSSQSTSLQLGSDKKIYVAKLFDPWLGVINNPNTLGIGCNFVDNAVSLAGKICKNGLPNFVPWYFKLPLPPFTASVNCLAATFTVSTVNITNCSGSANAVTSVSWDFGDPASGVNNTSTANNPTHTFIGAGTYTVTLVLNYACGNDIIQQNVTVMPGPTANAESNVTIVTGESTTLTASGGGNYLWSNGETTTTISVSPIVTTVYCITVTDANNCTDMACVTVTIEDSCSVAGELYLPNAFSPNKDSENDQFCLLGSIENCIKELKIIIYDHWGEKIYESTDPKFCWDGNYRGILINSSVFVYYLEATLVNEEKIRKKGNISLVR